MGCSSALLLILIFNAAENVVHISYYFLFLFLIHNLLDAFGNKTRIDYGTGDCFLMI